jgi:hypothetical protein
MVVQDLGFTGELIEKDTLLAIFSDVQRLHGLAGMIDEPRFIECLARVCITMLDDPPLCDVYPHDFERVDIVLKKAGLSSARDLARRMRSPDFGFLSYNNDAYPCLRKTDFVEAAILAAHATATRRLQPPIQQQPVKTRAPEVAASVFSGFEGPLYALPPGQELAEVPGQPGYYTVTKVPAQALSPVSRSFFPATSVTAPSAPSAPASLTHHGREGLRQPLPHAYSTSPQHGMSARQLVSPSRKVLAAADTSEGVGKAPHGDGWMEGKGMEVQPSLYQPLDRQLRVPKTTSKSPAKFTADEAYTNSSGPYSGGPYPRMPVEESEYPYGYGGSPQGHYAPVKPSPSPTRNLGVPAGHRSPMLASPLSSIAHQSLHAPHQTTSYGYPSQPSYGGLPSQLPSQHLPQGQHRYHAPAAAPGPEHATKGLSPMRSPRR